MLQKYPLLLELQNMISKEKGVVIQKYNYSLCLSKVVSTILVTSEYLKFVLTIHLIY